MLVLTRKTGTSIQIGENIKINFLRQSRGNIRVGIEAPKEVLIMRTEIMNKDILNKEPSTDFYKRSK